MLFVLVISVVHWVNFNFQDANNDVSKVCLFKYVTKHFFIVNNDINSIVHVDVTFASKSKIAH